MTGVSYGSLQFQEQIDFFRAKLNLPTNAWDDIFSEEHDRAFVIAGANKDALLSDFRSAIDDAIGNGTTLEAFRNAFDDIVEQHGWDYNGGRKWRTRVMYETNLFQSYNAGRYEQLQNDKAALPYWRYRHSDAVESPRHEHVGWDGLTLSADDPWWNTHFPANGWGCQCYVDALDADDLEDEGKSGPDTAPEIEYVDHVIGKNSPNGPRTIGVPKGIDPGFDYAPGRSRLNSHAPPETPWPPIKGTTGGKGLPNLRPSDKLPSVRTLPKSALLDKGFTETEYATAFLEPFGATLTEPAVFLDVMESPLVISSELFTVRKKNKRGTLKTDKNGRGQFMGILAKAVMEPDEIWVRYEYNNQTKKPMVRRRYIARFTVPGQDVSALAVFEHSTDGWSGITTYQSDDDIEDLRVGVRLYKRST